MATSMAAAPSAVKKEANQPALQLARIWDQYGMLVIFAILFLFAIIIALGLRVWYEGSHYMNDVLGLESADARSRSLSDALLDLTFERARSAVSNGRAWWLPR